MKLQLELETHAAGGSHEPSCTMPAPVEHVFREMRRDNGGRGTWILPKTGHRGTDFLHTRGSRNHCSILDAEVLVSVLVSTALAERELGRAADPLQSDLRGVAARDHRHGGGVARVLLSGEG
jgi:hypothetical protein